MHLVFDGVVVEAGGFNVQSDAMDVYCDIEDLQLTSLATLQFEEPKAQAAAGKIDGFSI